MEACSRPWDKIEIGGVEKRLDDAHALSANHVYVDGETPFLIAATSVESPTGEEFFGITIIKDPAAVQKFLEGPYPPHNRPRTLSLEQIIGEDVGAFMKAAKQVHVLRHTVRFAADVATLVPIENGLAMEASGIRLNVFADEEIPMGLKVAWNKASLND